ncbi:MAG: hypothetical protein Aurels2KO_39520 [Aureliella sp.]
MNRAVVLGISLCLFSASELVAGHDSNYRHYLQLARTGRVQASLEYRNLAFSGKQLSAHEFFSLIEIALASKGDIGDIHALILSQQIRNQVARIEKMLSRTRNGENWEEALGLAALLNELEGGAETANLVSCLRRIPEKDVRRPHFDRFRFFYREIEDLRELLQKLALAIDISEEESIRRLRDLQNTLKFLAEKPCAVASSAALRSVRWLETHGQCSLLVELFNSSFSSSNIQLAIRSQDVEQEVKQLLVATFGDVAKEQGAKIDTVTLSIEFSGGRRPQALARLDLRGLISKPLGRRLLVHGFAEACISKEFCFLDSSVVSSQASIGFSGIVNSVTPSKRRIPVVGTLVRGAVKRVASRKLPDLEQKFKHKLRALELDLDSYLPIASQAIERESKTLFGDETRTGFAADYRALSFCVKFGANLCLEKPYPKFSGISVHESAIENLVETYFGGRTLDSGSLGFRASKIESFTLDHVTPIRVSLLGTRTALVKAKVIHFQAMNNGWPGEIELVGKLSWRSEADGTLRFELVDGIRVFCDAKGARDLIEEELRQVEGQLHKSIVLPTQISNFLALDSEVVEGQWINVPLRLDNIADYAGTLLQEKQGLQTNWGQSWQY